MIIVMCVDDANRPSDIPIEEWVVRGVSYTVTKHIANLKQGRKGIVAKSLKLKEIEISNPKYSGYNINRFTIPSFGTSIAKTLEDYIDEQVSIGELEYVEEGQEV